MLTWKCQKFFFVNVLGLAALQLEKEGYVLNIVGLFLPPLMVAFYVLILGIM